MNTPVSSAFARLARILAAVSVVPALFLPFYQAFLHGGRRAVDINAGKPLKSLSMYFHG